MSWLAMGKSFAGSEDGAIARRFGRPVYRHGGGIEAMVVFGVGSDGCFMMFCSPINRFRCVCLEIPEVTRNCPQILAPEPTATPESAGLCALGSAGNLDRVTDFQ